MIELVISGVYILGLISGLLFLSLLVKVVYGHFSVRRDEELLEEVKDEVNSYLAGDEVELADQISKRKIRILEKVIIDYLKQLRGETAKRLKELAERTGIVKLNIEQLIEDKQWWQKSEAAYNLGNLGAQEAIDPLLDYLEAKNSDLRYQSALALAKIAGANYLSLIIDKLLELKFYPEDVILRLIEIIDEDIYPIMRELIATDQIEKKVIAIRSLGMKQDYRVLGWIKKYIKSDNGSLLISSLKAAYQLGDVDDADYFKLLLTAKENSTTAVRANLAKVLERFRNLESRRVLQELMTDSQWQVRYNAAQSLLAHGIEGLMALSEQLHSKDRFAQDMAWQTLQEEIIFNDVLKKEIISNYPQLIKNIKNYLEFTDKEGVNLELEDYIN